MTQNNAASAKRNKEQDNMLLNEKSDEF